MDLKFLSQIPDPMTIEEVVEAARVNRSTVYRWFDKGLESFHVGGCRRIPKDSFIKFIRTSSGETGGNE